MTTPPRPPEWVRAADTTERDARALIVTGWGGLLLFGTFVVLAFRAGQHGAAAGLAAFALSSAFAIVYGHRARRPATLPPDEPTAPAAMARTSEAPIALAFLTMLALVLAAVLLWKTLGIPAGRPRWPGFTVVAICIGLAFFFRHVGRVDASRRYDDEGVHGLTPRGMRTLRWSDVVEVRSEPGNMLALRDAEGEVTHIALRSFRDPAAAAAFIHARTRHASGSEPPTR